MLTLGLGLGRAAARGSSGAGPIAFSAGPGTSVQNSTVITRDQSSPGYAALARSERAVPPGADVLLAIRSRTDDAQFAVGFGGPAAASLDAFEWYVECDGSQLYARSYLHGSRMEPHGVADTRAMRIFLRRQAGVWSVLTGPGDDPAQATTWVTYDDSPADGGSFHATALLHTPGMALELVLTA